MEEVCTGGVRATGEGTAAGGQGGVLRRVWVGISFIGKERKRLASEGLEARVRAFTLTNAGVVTGE